MTVHHRILATSDEFRALEFRCSIEHEAGRAMECRIGHDIVLVRRGAFVSRTRGRDFLAIPGRALLFPPHRAFRVDHPFGNDEGLTISLTDGFLEEQASKERARALFRHGEIDLPPRSLLKQKALVANSSDPLVSAEIASEIVVQVLDFALRPMDAPSRTAPAAHVAEIVESRFCERLTLADLASQVGVSSFHLARMFRRAFGDSIHQYRNTLRLLAAVRRLEQGETDLAQIAIDTGYFDHSHFTAAFRKRFGVSPSTYRQYAAGARKKRFASRRRARSS